MAGFLDFLQHSGIDPVKSSIKRPVQAGKDLIQGKPGKAFSDLRHIVSDNEKAQSKGMGDYGVHGWVGKHPLESAAAVVATIYGGAAAAGAYGAGSAGAAGGSGALAGSTGAAGAGAGASTAAPITAAVGTPTAAGAASSGAGAASSAPASSGMLSTLTSNPAYMQMGMSMLSGSNGQPAQPNAAGGTSSLGGVGYQAYMYPGSSTQIAPPAPKQDDATKSPAMIAAGQAPSATSGASAASTPAMANTFTPPKNETQAPAPISAATGTKVDNRSFMEKMNDASAKQWNKATGGKGENDNRSFLERMNAASSDQWDNFTGQGKYDKSNPANQDAKGNFKAPQGTMNFQDKMQAGFGMASLLMNAFDRR